MLKLLCHYEFERHTLYTQVLHVQIYMNTSFDLIRILAPINFNLWVSIIIFWTFFMSIVFGAHSAALKNSLFSWCRVWIVFLKPSFGFINTGNSFLSVPLHEQKFFHSQCYASGTNPPTVVEFRQVWFELLTKNYVYSIQIKHYLFASLPNTTKNHEICKQDYGTFTCYMCTTIRWTFLRSIGWLKVSHNLPSMMVIG